jgi:hypothetical protein
MNEVRVRLIFHDTLGTRERRAAYAGTSAFERFGVTCDCVDASNRKALRCVRAGEMIGRIVMAEKPVVRLQDLAFESLWAMAYPKTIYGLGVTPRRLNGADNKAADAPLVLGVGLNRSGGVLSVFRMLETEGELGENAVAAAVRHELGHIFLKVKNGEPHYDGGHCRDTDCIMQKNGNYNDFIERFVKPGLGFCLECAGRINAAISLAMCSG